MNFKKVLKENKNIIISAIFAIIVLCIILFSKEKPVNLPAGDTIAKNIPDYQSILNSIEAKSFYIYDISENKTIFSKDEHLKLPLASIAKLMSGLVVLDVMPDNTVITISRDDITMEGDTGLLIGEKWKIKDLLDYSLITSSNDGMHAISSAFNSYQSTNDKSTIETMNENAISMGLKDTIFVNETGLDVNVGMSGAYSSAYDVSQLLSKIIKDEPELILNTSKQTETFTSLSNIKHVATNTNISINQISGMIASKTGFTDLAGGNLAVIFDAGIMHPIVIVVLGSTIDGRFNDVVKLAKITLEKLSE